VADAVIQSRTAPVRHAATRRSPAAIERAAECRKTIAAKPRPRGENVVDLMDALKKSIAGESAAPKGTKPRKASAGQKEMLLPIAA